MKLKIVSTLALLAALEGSVPAAGADNRYPDWPCRQLKVPELSIAAIWPDAADGMGNPASQVPGLDGIVAGLAQRRTPMEEAEKQISAFIVGTEAGKKEKANALFMKLFDALNAQRFQVMNGLERAYSRQKDFAEKIRADMAKLRDLDDEKAGEVRLREELLQQVAITGNIPRSTANAWTMSGVRGLPNRSLAQLETVSGASKRKLENGERRQPL